LSADDRLAADKPSLVEYVRRNLKATLYFLEPNGEVDTTASRRQDQKAIREVWLYLTQFPGLALHTRDGRLTTVAKSIEQRGTGRIPGRQVLRLRMSQYVAPRTARSGFSQAGGWDYQR